MRSVTSGYMDVLGITTKDDTIFQKVTSPKVDMNPKMAVLDTLILDGVRAIKNRIKRQGHKGRKKCPGRPSKKVQQQRQRRQGMSKKEQAAFIWEHQYLIVRKQEELSDQDKADLALMFPIAPELKLFRQFNRQFYRLFAKGITKQQQFPESDKTQ